jgi:hypothetical protein
METIAIIVFGGVCFISGMYASSQLSRWIDKSIEKCENCKCGSGKCGSGKCESC